MIKEKVKIVLKSSPFLKTTAFVAHDILYGLRLASGKINSDSGATHASLSEAESVAYIEEVFSDYKHYGNLEKFCGVAAEIGPGDSAGVALLMRSDGCSQVDLIDRYFSFRNPQQQSKIYQALADTHQLNNFSLQDSWDEQALTGINWQVGQPAEVYFEKCNIKYDFIVSRAVLEHLYNPLDALRFMVASLKPGGQMFHKIDFRDHGMFSTNFHELTFLQVPSFVYPLMVQNTGRPNRILVHRYRDVLEEMRQNGLIDYTILVTRLVSYGDISPHQKYENINLDQRSQAISFVEQHRPKFAKEFDEVDSADLAVAGIFLILNKK